MLRHLLHYELALERLNLSFLDEAFAYVTSPVPVEAAFEVVVVLFVPDVVPPEPQSQQPPSFVAPEVPQHLPIRPLHSCFVVVEIVTAVGAVVVTWNCFVKRDGDDDFVGAVAVAADVDGTGSWPQLELLASPWKK